MPPEGQKFEKTDASKQPQQSAGTEDFLRRGLAGADLQSAVDAKPATNSIRAEKENAALKQSEDSGRFEKFEKQIDGVVQKSKDRLKDLPKSFQDSLHDNLVQYLRTSVARYGTDKEAGLSAAEFEQYKQDMLQKVNEIIARYAPSAAELEARKKQQEGGAEVAAAAEKSSAVEIKDTNFNEANLQSPQGIQQELAKFNAQSADMNKEVGALSVNIGNFQQAYQRFDAGKKEWGVFLRGGTGFGLFETAPDPETEQLKKQLETLKSTLDEKIQKLKEKQRNLAEYGRKLNETGDTMKQQKIDERDKKLGEIDAQGTEAERAKKKNEAQYRALESQQQKLYSQRDAMADHYDGLAQELTGISKSREEVRVKSDQMKTFGGQLDGALSAIDEALGNDPPSPQKEELEAKKQELLGHKQNVDAAVSQTREGEGQLSAAEQAVQEKRGEAGATLVTVDDYLTKTVEPSLEALSGSIRTIELAKLKNGTQREQMEAEYAEIFKTIDTVDAAVADNVLQNNLANEQVISSLVTQRQSLDAISIDRPNIWDATGGLVFGKIGEGFSLLTKDLICGELLDPASKWLKKVTKEIPVLNVITEAVTNMTIDLASGIIEGAGELVGGIATMVAHPIDTIAGIGTLIGRNPQTGKWSLSNAGNAWREMGKALIAYENFSKGEVGKGVGKVALNVILTATGVGAAAKGAQGASIAYSVARTAGAGVTRAALKAAGVGAKLFVEEFSGGIAKLPGEAVSGVGKLLKAPASIVKNMRLGTAGRLGKEISDASGELSKVTGRLKEFTIGGKKAGELEALAGKTSRELLELSAKDLAKAGIKDSGSIREFLEYKKTLQTSESLQGSIGALSHQKELAEIAPGLEKAIELKGNKLKRFVEEFNGKHPEGFGEKSFAVVHESEDGILAFNAKGKLQIFESRSTLDRVLSKMDQFTIAGKKVSEIEGLKGKSSVELEALTERQLAEFGIRDGRSIREFNVYRDLLKSKEGIQESARTVLRDIKKLDHDPKNPLNTFRMRQECLRMNPKISTSEAYTFGDLPKEKPLMKAYLHNPENWIPERRALHKELLEKDYQDALALSNRVNRDPPVIILMRGNTAAGKTTSIREAPPPRIKQLNLLDERGKLRGAINPDDNKAILRTHEKIGDSHTIDHSQAHPEGAILAEKQITRLFAEKRSFVIDKRLAPVDDVDEVVLLAREKGYRIVMVDVDAELATSIDRVHGNPEKGIVGRNSNGNDPIVPKKNIEDGFDQIRKARRAIESRADEYYLYKTDLPEGQNRLVAQIIDGHREILQPQIYGEISPLTNDYYIDQAMENLRTTSRTSRGVVDTSATTVKASSMTEGLSPATAAKKANENFHAVIKFVYKERQRSFSSPAELRTFVEQIAKDVNGGILKDDILLRRADSPKFPYTKVADLPKAAEDFYAELFRRLNDPATNPQELAAWVEWNIDLTHHFFEDGCGKTAKAVSTFVLARYDRPLPRFRTRNEYYAAAEPRNLQQWTNSYQTYFSQ